MSPPASRQSFGKYKQRSQKKFMPYTELDFAAINSRALNLARHIQDNVEELADILLEYESFEVVQDETERTLDLLNNLHENKKYFRLRVGSISSFLPRNQPLYAFTCFVIVPSLMASEVHFRIPFGMRHFFPKLLKFLSIDSLFPNIIVSHKERLDFLRERSALLLHPKTSESMPVTEVVIFTGTSHHAEKLRKIFDSRTLFIANGSGHNPIVVSENADIKQSVEATLTLQLYNQGQDCAAPNAILVHEKIFPEFLALLRTELCNIQVGHYSNRLCRVGPISEPEDLVRIQSLLIENRRWIDPTTPGIIRSHDAILEPTILSKPLREGGNFSEVFAPIIFLQKYEDDADLKLYFESPLYARNAMYISLFGTSKYVEGLIGKSFNGKILHDEISILRNVHLHMRGIERGTQPYGGYGDSASSISIDGKIMCKPTLPQRDIFEFIAKPMLNPRRREERKKNTRAMKTLVEKDVHKLLKIKTRENDAQNDSLWGRSYYDTRNMTAGKHRYVELKSEQVFSFLPSLNLDYVSLMDVRRVRQIRSLYSFLQKEHPLQDEELTQFLYNVTKRKGLSEAKSRGEQLQFFRDIYQLLFGKESGPRLPRFLLEADRKKILYFLNI